MPSGFLSKKKRGQNKDQVSTQEGVGFCWGCISMDCPTRFVVALSFAAWEYEVAFLVVAKMRQRTSGQQGVSWVSDGRDVYRREVRRVYREPKRLGKGRRHSLVFTFDVGLTQAFKHLCDGKVVRIKVKQVLGQPVECPYAVHVERLNGILRDGLNCLSRKTHAFAKREHTWDGALVLACLRRIGCALIWLCVNLKMTFPRGIVTDTKVLRWR